MSNCKLSTSAGPWISHRISYYSIDLPPNAVIQFENDSQTGIIKVNNRTLIYFQNGYVTGEQPHGRTLKADTVGTNIISIKSVGDGPDGFYFRAYDTASSLFGEKEFSGLSMQAGKFQKNDDFSQTDQNTVLKIFNSVVPDIKARTEAEEKVIKAMEEYRKKHPQEK